MPQTPMPLDGSPPVPPDVNSQMGGESPMASLGASIGQQSKPPASPGAAHPQGALGAMMEPIEKVLTQMARMNDKMSPYVERALALLKAGVAQAMELPGGNNSAEAGPGGAPAAPIVSPNPEAMRGMPGAM